MYGTRAENVLPIVVPTMLLDTVFTDNSMSYMLSMRTNGAGGQTRTGTRFPSPDFKSGMSTNSITPACNFWSSNSDQIIQPSFRIDSNQYELFSFML